MILIQLTRQSADPPAVRLDFIHGIGGIVDPWGVYFELAA
jgi:hypothetical protein